MILKSGSEFWTALTYLRVALHLCDQPLGDLLGVVAIVCEGEYDLVLQAKSAHRFPLGLPFPRLQG